MLRPCGDFKRNYSQEEAILQTRFIKVVIPLFVLTLYCLPLFLGDFYLYLLNLVFIAILGAQGINILTGFTGQISLGHGAFIGIGAYTAGVFSTKLGFSVWVVLPAAGCASALIGVMVGVPSLRIKGFYLAMATLALQFLMEYLFMELRPITGGSEGLYLERPSIFGLVLDTDRQFYFLGATIAILATLGARNLLRTRVGRAFISIRDRDIAAELIGVDIFKYKIMSFAISSFYAGVAGALLAYYITVINPQSFSIHLSIDYLAMIIIGGLGSVLGAIYGAIFIVLFPEFLKIWIEFAAQYLPIDEVFPAIREILFGFIIVFFLIFEPEGLAKIWWNIKAYWKLWPFSY
ncbi:MAG: branched-chain amino acid ABC transporter permease [Desulfatiglans sp.]|jgi:branched-chain amino acid transport system permease protein|nr:branched-chain amino acid ABC transporter permease [Thermodesulfobacteriota bacterium]MEE4354203.1 branched-chain amino acid ABC transporter permease [Desulfatiglans sp.]